MLSKRTNTLEPEEKLLAGVIRRALWDAQYAKDERLRTEAMAWLWSVAPIVAEQFAIPKRRLTQPA